MPELGEWANFYVVVGSSAGALIGLQFVVMALVAEKPPPQAAAASAAFATPNIVHFSAVLFLSAVLLAPWHAIAPLVVLWALVALTGVSYVAVVARRMRLQSAYKPECEDWCFHAVLPLAAYATLGLAAVAARTHARGALFGAGAAELLLLLIGIHNTWDAIVWHVVVNKRPDQG